MAFVSNYNIEILDARYEFTRLVHNFIYSNFKQAISIDCPLNLCTFALNRSNEIGDKIH